MTNPTLLLLDFSAVYAIAWNSTGDHEDVGAAHARTVRMCRGLIAQLPADCVVLCGDTPRNWRHDVYSSYKASRAAKPPGYGDQMRAAWRQLQADGATCIRVEGYEADDVIATLAHAWAAEGEDRRVRIVTHDKDLEQLVDDQTTIISLSDWTSSGALVERTPETVRAKRGVEPHQLGDWLAMMGDKSDNVPGVPGIGEKRAAQLLAEHHDLDTVLALATSEQRPPGAMWARIAECAEQARVSRRLVELCNVAPLALPWRTAAQGATSETEEPARPAEEKNMSDETSTEHTSDHEPAAGPPRLTSPRYEPEPEVPPTALVKAGDITPSDGMRPTEWSHSLEPTTPRQAFEMARALHDSGLFRQTFPTPSAVFSAMLLARSHGVETMKVLMPGMMHNIKGKLAMSAQMIVGLVLRSGKAEYMECIESTAERAVYVTKRRGGKHEQRSEWTVERARTAGYLSKGDSQWARDPATMLRHRASTELARMAYPDVVGGLYDPSEFVDANGGAQ